MPYDPFAVEQPTMFASAAPQAATSGLAPTNALAPAMPQNRLPNSDRKLAMGQFRDARLDWRSGMPHFGQGQSPQDFHTSLTTWLAGRPDRQDYWSHGQFGDAYAAPGAAPPASIAAGEPAPGSPGIVPPHMLPPTHVGMAPGVPGSVGANPGGGTTGAPLQANDWRTLVANYGARF